jgi:hypothetical protein
MALCMSMSHVYADVHVCMEMGLISLIRYGLRRSVHTPRQGAGLRHAASRGGSFGCSPSRITGERIERRSYLKPAGGE